MKLIIRDDSWNDLATVTLSEDTDVDRLMKAICDEVILQKSPYTPEEENEMCRQARKNEVHRQMREEW